MSLYLIYSRTYNKSEQITCEIYQNPIPRKLELLGEPSRSYIFGCLEIFP